MHLYLIHLHAQCLMMLQRSLGPDVTVSPVARGFAQVAHHRLKVWVLRLLTLHLVEQ